MLKTLKLWITNTCLIIGTAIAFVLGMALWIFVIMPICLLLAGLALYLVLLVLGGPGYPLVREGEADYFVDFAVNETNKKKG